MLVPYDTVHLVTVVDSQRRADEAAIDIGACMEPSMGGTDPHGAYAILKRWYRHASARAPNPSETDMEKVRGDSQTVYQREEPHTPGPPLAIHINPSKVNNKIPS